MHKFIFSVGYKLDYWDSDDELFVESKYDSLKHEILNNKIYKLNMNQLKISLHKINKYFRSKKVRKMIGDWRGRRYGIFEGDLITLNHLLSIVIYCDWSDFCTAFRSTFRKNKSYQTIQSIVKKNKEFANISKLIIETVNVYGTETDFGNTYFCGMSHLMVLPEFSMDLNCPTSTSKTLEIVCHRGDNGIITQLNANNNNTFCTSWLSNYGSEDEWLFVETYNARIETVIIQNTSQNFKEIFHALYCFHSMIKGEYNHFYDPTHNDYLILYNLIEYKLITNKFKYTYPKYIHNTFHSFINNINEITLNLECIATNYKQFKSLIFYSSNNTMTKDKKEMKKDINPNKWNKNDTIKMDIFKLFTNLKEIQIITNDNYQFDLLLLLTEIRGLSLFSTYKLSSSMKTKFKSEILSIVFDKVKKELVIKQL